MDVYAKYFQRLVAGNSPQLFPGINRNVENPGNHQLLVEEIEKASSDPEQAKKIAEIIDVSEGDIYRDFDLSTFINHFRLSPIAKATLASAFTEVTKSDLRNKGMSFRRSICVSPNVLTSASGIFSCYEFRDSTERLWQPSDTRRRYFTVSTSYNCYKNPSGSPRIFQGRVRTTSSMRSA